MQSDLWSVCDNQLTKRMKHSACCSSRRLRRVGLFSKAVACMLPTVSLFLLCLLQLRVENATWSMPSAGYQLTVPKAINPTAGTHDSLVAPSFPTCDECCYRYITAKQGVLELLNKSALEEKGCKQRLPGALIIGVKKCGTTTLRNFLSYHPDIALAQSELNFFSSSDLEKGLEFYRSVLPYSTPGQVSMEKSPAYSLFPNVHVAIKTRLPNVKLLVIMRDPVERAVSDFLHLQATILKLCLKTDTMPTNVTLRETCESFDRYKINDTFEDSVIDSDGHIRVQRRLVSVGVYVKDMRRFLEKFKREQILALDGEAFIRNPYPVVKQAEQFLGIRDYFKPDHFYYDPQKKFFCLNKPIPKNCMRKAKGRPHPAVNNETLKKLRDYYRPYNKALNELMGVDFHWSS